MGACSRLLAAALVVGVTASMTATADDAHRKAAPVFGVTIPDGYREWQLVSVAAHAGAADELKAILGNPLAMTAYRQGARSFPDGAVLAKLSWAQAPLDGFTAAFVPGAPVRLEFMVKDARRYAETGGWGFGRFVDDKPADEAQHKTCFTCHAASAAQDDFVFTRFAR